MRWRAIAAPFQVASTFLQMSLNALLILSLLLLDIMALVGILNAMRKHPLALHSWGIRLLVLSLPFMMVGIEGYMLGNSLQRDAMISFLTDIALVLFGIGIAILAVGLIAVIIEVIIEAIKGR